MIATSTEAITARISEANDRALKKKKKKTRGKKKRRETGGEKVVADLERDWLSSSGDA